MPSGPTTCCCSAANPPACRKRCTGPRRRGSSFRCGQAFVPSTWRWRPPWRSGKHYGKPEAFRRPRAEDRPKDAHQDPLEQIEKFPQILGDEPGETRVAYAVKDIFLTLQGEGAQAG